MFTTPFGDSITAARIGSFLRVNGKALEHSYVKMATGSNVTQPSDNVSDYFRIDSYSIEQKKYGDIGRSIDEATSFLDYTESANQMIWDDLSQMQGMVKDYYAPGTTADMQTKLVQLFNQAKLRIAKTQEGAVWDGKQVLADSSVSPLISMNTDPKDTTQRFTVGFGSETIVNSLALDITSGEDAITDALDVQFGKAASFAGQLTGYRYGLNAQRKMAEVMEKGSGDAIRTVQEVDEASELFSITKKSIQQQAAMSMLAQSGMSQSSLLKLVS